MNIIRKHIISKLLNIPLEGEELEIYNFITEWLTGLTVTTINNTPFYMKGDKYVLYEIEEEPTYFCVRYNDFWEVLKIKYLMKHKDIQKLLKYFIEKHFKQKIIPSYYNVIWFDTSGMEMEL